MKNMRMVVCLFALLCLARLAYGVVGTKKGFSNDQIQLKEQVTGTITRIDGSRLRVVEDEDRNGCATAGIRLVHIVESTKLFRGSAEITGQDLRRGDHVVIDATVRGEILEASEIRLNDLSSPEHTH